MNSSLIGKIEKAHRYAQEPERIRFDMLQATFHGGHDDYTVRLERGGWTCTCHTFASHSIGETCSHIMAMQRILGVMLDEAAKYGAAEPAAVS